MKTEYLHATDIFGKYVKTAERTALITEIRNYSRTNGDAPVAVPVVHVILMTSNGAIRLVQRGDKAENPFMWDKSVGGHVVTEDKTLSRKSFDDNAKKEMAEEIGVKKVLIAQDSLDFHHRVQSEDHDFSNQALLQLIDYDPWLGSICQVKEGAPWLKRANTATYLGIYDGKINFVDGEAIDHRSVERAELMGDLRENPWKYADGVRILMQRYYALLRVVK
ncbi:MAG: NUDIX domain-containing protein [Magnetococcales bacterium]|nr:NUDIX domain-containing protein [Magnetococcales bacterium]